MVYMSIPQGIHVIEETQITYKKYIQTVGSRCITYSRRHGTLNTIHSTITFYCHPVRQRKQFRQSDYRTVSQMQDTTCRQPPDQLSDSCQFRISDLGLNQSITPSVPKPGIIFFSLHISLQQYPAKICSRCLYHSSQGTEQIGYLTVRTNMPVSQRSDPSKIFLQPL